MPKNLINVVIKGEYKQVNLKNLMSFFKNVKKGTKTLCNKAHTVKSGLL